MKKTYSKAELEIKAKDVFKNYPDAKVVHATTDGQFFLDKNRANLHAGSKGTVISIENGFEAEDLETSNKSDSKKSSNKKTSKKQSNKKAPTGGNSPENRGEGKTSKPAAAKSEEIDTGSAEFLIAEAKTIETVKALDAAILLETEGKNRKTVLAAYDARQDELKTDK